MAAALDEIRKAGRRFYLALVDPLLEKPNYFALRKPEVTVGFLPDCDWTLPWASMGLNIISDSRRFDATHADSMCDLVPNSENFCAPRIGKREKEPLFKMTFDPLSGWEAVCPPNHACGLHLHERRPPRVFLIGAGNIGSSCKLADGSTFRLLWPLPSPWQIMNGFKLPIQHLDFIFVACHKDDFPSRHHLGGETNLLSLPKEVLALISSHLQPEEFLGTLAVVGRIFTSPLMKDRVPWKTVTLDASFDSLRIAPLASAMALRAVKCERIWSSELKSGFYTTWKHLICHEHLKVLDLEDPELLTFVGVPPCLEEMRFRMSFPSEGYWDPVTMLKFPASIRRVCVKWQKPETDDSESFHRMSPKILFTAFPQAAALHFCDVPFDKEAWDQVSFSHLQGITSLFAATPEKFCSYIPIERMTNLVFLHLRGGYLKGLHRLRGTRFPSLEHLVMEFDHFDDTNPWGPCTHLARFEDAPKLRFLHVERDLRAPVAGISLSKLSVKHPNLQYLYLKGVNVKLRDVCELMKRMPSLKDIEILALSEYDSFPRSAFPQYPGAILRWSWFKRNTVRGFEFVFTRITNEERDEAMKPMTREFCTWD